MRTEQKLTISHLQHYLAYGLRVQLSQKGIFNLDEEFPQSHNEICEITNLVKCNDNWEVEISSDKDYSYGLIELDEIAPLLLPLSALYEEIDGEIPIVYIASIICGIDREWTLLETSLHCEGNDCNYHFFYDDGSFHYVKSFDDSTFKNIRVDNQLRAFEYCYSKHIDLEQLIDKGLAIDKRSVK